MLPFRLSDPLPPVPSTTVLEASAGAGKTWTIGALVARYVAEGIPLDQLLVVTFGRAATRELRERVREQLQHAAGVLRSGVGADELAAVLLEGDDAEQARRAARIEAALASYDAATIATTHEFCAIVLRSLGVAGDSDPGATLIEDLHDLVREVVDDLYLQRYASTAQPPLSAADALRIGIDAVEFSSAKLEADPASAERLAFAEAVRAEVDKRKRTRGVLSYDDLLSRLASALAESDSAAALRMRRRWSVVLVDEFQDTDPVQWQVLERAFNGHAAMVLIGDPKQAIYAFRGGDVPSYLEAARTAGERRTLDANWRSDAPLVDALGVLLTGAALGHADISVHQVEARHPGSRLVGAPESAPVRLRLVDGEAITGDPERKPRIDDVRALVARDLAADVARLLLAKPTFDGEPLVAGDIAIVAYSHKASEVFTRALAAHGIASVVTSGGSVLLSDAAAEWLVLLEALEQPQRSGRIRALALTSFVGLRPADLGRDDDVTDHVAELVRGWLDLFRSHGIAAIHESALAAGLAARVLAQPDGDRRLTDLTHMAQVLHEGARRDSLGLAALIEWLRAERLAARRSTERARRLDSDRNAVQLVTVHGSKGLQYPVVYLPTLFNRYVGKDTTPLFHDAAGQRCLDVGSPVAGEARAAALREDAAEELRLTYVAMTRAQSQVVLWWAPTQDAANGGPSRLLLGRAPGAPAVPDKVAVPGDAMARERFEEWQAAGGLVLEPARVPAQTLVVEHEPALPLDYRRFTRTIDRGWRRTSYSGLVRADEQASFEPEVRGTIDEDAPDESVVHADRPEAPTSPMAALPAGATFGSLVHAVLEVADPRTSDEHAELRARATEQLVYWPCEVNADQIAEALVAVNHTPLGALVDGRTLGDFGLTDRLCELDFEIPLNGGDFGADAEVLLAAFASVLRRHLPADDPLVSYAERLESPGLGGQELRGYLSGSIDVVLRQPAGYVVVDYKTNRLGPPTEVPTAYDYRPEALAEAMLHSHYPLQAILYSVVLHRFLRWRLPDYDPARDLGGVLYLYLRGMCGPETPVYDGHTAGVFSWRPPAAMVVELSDLLAGGAR